MLEEKSFILGFILIAGVLMFSTSGIIMEVYAAHVQDPVEEPARDGGDVQMGSQCLWFWSLPYVSMFYSERKKNIFIFWFGQSVSD